MRKFVKVLFAAFLISFGISASAQAPPPPPGNAKTGGGGSTGPVGAPIDGGSGILMIMGAAWGGMKLYQMRKKSA